MVTARGCTASNLIDHPAGSLKDLGLTREPKGLFLSKDWVNNFCRRIGLSMRKGTAKFSETQPEQVQSFRVIMMRRLLYVMVIHVIIPALVFQFDETGISLLGFGKEGRAQKGASQFTLRGLDDKRQVTASIVINGELRDFGVADPNHLGGSRGEQWGMS